MTVLAEIEQAVSTVAERVAPAVVTVQARGRGSGVVVAKNRVLTNAHNVSRGGATVRLADGSTVEASLAGVDTDADLAVLAIDTGDAQPLTWAEDGTPPLGKVVLAVAASSTGPRVTWGALSATQRSFRGPGGRRIRGALEHTAPLARGSSGSPLVDLEGRLVGLNTHRLGDGFYLAVPADSTLRTRVEALARGEQRRRPRLGLALAPSEVGRELRAAVGLPEREGLLVRGVVEGGPAQGAGVRQGDLLVEVGGRATVSVDEVHAALDEADEAAPLPLRLVRGTDELSVTLTLGQAGDGEGGRAT